MIEVQLIHNAVNHCCAANLCMYICCCWVAAGVSDPVQPQRRQPPGLPRPWDSPGKNTGVGCHFLLQCMKGKSESEVAQSCPTLSDPTDCSPPGSSVRGIFQVRALEWGAVAFSNAWKWKVKVRSLSRVQLFATPWTAAYQAPGKSIGMGSITIAKKTVKTLKYRHESNKYKFSQQTFSKHPKVLESWFWHILKCVFIYVRICIYI